MVELVDTQDLESCEATRTGSIPAIRTKLLNIIDTSISIYFLNLEIIFKVIESD